ncbi:hypothetical protein [Pararhizobium sp. PWRC1-1]|uniref:hypothetical protein n=1 Tax=Pararhizobium sp. PWRC1-1 TaxID=2804566 RepID=UPI003CEB84B4
MTFDKSKDEPVLGETIPVAVIDVARQTISVPKQKAQDPTEQISALRRELEALKIGIEDAGKTVAGRAKKAGQRLEDGVGGYPVTSVGAVVVATVVVALLIGPLVSPPEPPMSRYRRMLRQLRHQLEQRY